jgi:type IV secretion system protein VirD4
MLKAVVFVLVGAFAFVIGYPIAAAVAHGLDPTLWPPVVLTPEQWMAGFTRLRALPNLAALLSMAQGQSDAFAGGGCARYWQ